MGMTERVVQPPNMPERERVIVVVVANKGCWVPVGEHPRQGSWWWALRRRGFDVKTVKVDGADWLYARWTHGPVTL
jgi:hypothetical protein